jgi:micrococcal nuclease
LDLDIDLGLGVHNYQRVRLLGVDAPETYGVKKDSEEYAAGVKAKQAVETWLGSLGDPRPLWVSTQKDKTGKYGRYLATIWFELEGEVINLNEYLVREGLAVAKTY